MIQNLFQNDWKKNLVLYTNIVAQIIQSRSRMTCHLSQKKNVILRFDFNCAHVII